MDPNQFINDVVVNGKRKAFRKGTMIPVNDLVDPSEKKQGINIREETI
jgi:hypothetical protein